MARAAGGDPFDVDDEEARFDVRSLARTALWGTAAAAAVAGAVFAAQSETGASRLAAALNKLPGTATHLQASANPRNGGAPSPQDPRRTAESVEALLIERSRLLARLEALERTADITGSVPRAPDTGAAASTTTKTEFGVDLGGETTLDGLRTIWNSVTAQHGAVLSDLRPVVGIREGARPEAVELRLVAGPLANAAMAARICATLASTGRACQPTTFEGQRLALR